MHRKQNIKTFFITDLKEESLALICNPKDQLGEGKYAAVYLVQTTNFDLYALKIQLTGSEAYLSLYKKEIDIMRTLTNANASNVVKLIGSSINEITSITLKVTYQINIAMTYAYHGSLASWLKSPQKNARLGPKKDSIAFGIVTGLNELHKRDILHGDLKSHNVVIDSQFQPLLCDFGLSKRIGIDNTRTITGTPLCFAPNVLIHELTYYKKYEPKEEQSKKDDMYSLSLLLWCLYAGQELPFENFNAATLIDWVWFQQQREKIPLNCPSNAVKLIEQAWSPDPNKRPSTEEALEILNPDIKPASQIVNPPQNPPASPPKAKKLDPEIIKEQRKSFSDKKTYLQSNHLFKKKTPHSLHTSEQITTTFTKKFV